MDEIFMRESLIFSKQWNKEDIIKILNFKKENKEEDIISEDDDEDIENQKINLGDYTDLLDKFSYIFKQEEIEHLKNNYQFLLEYFYLREIMIEEYISDKFKYNDKQRHLNSKLADYLLRAQFEENEAIKEDAKLINQFISEINESYFKEENIEDLSDKTYMYKIEGVLGTMQIPNFLLREGFRIRRQIKNNKDIFIKNTEVQKNYEDKSTDFSDDDNFKFNDSKDNIIINNEIYDIKDIINEIENNGKLPFARHYNEVYIIIFFMALKEIKGDDLYEDIKTNLNIFIDYFKIETYKTYEEIKQNYIDINSELVPKEIISMEFSDINKCEYTRKYILASFKVLINKIFNDPSYEYINLLLFLQKYISEDNKLLKRIIENEINSSLKGNDQNLLYITVQCLWPIYRIKFT